MFCALKSAATAHAQEPTPTSASNSNGMYITVISTEPQINVRMGPGSIAYPVVGTLLPGQTAPALGRSPGGDWIQISYPGAPFDAGWVYAALVQVSPGTLNISEPPPTLVPPPTPTIDPTLLAQFSTQTTVTRLPTFTPPPSLSIPAFTDTPSAKNSLPFPMAGAVIFFAIIGLMGLLASFMRRS